MQKEKPSSRVQPIIVIAICTLLSSTLFTACGPNFVYEVEEELPAAGWTYQDSLQATFTITDTNQIYNLHLQLNHSPDFAFQNVYVKMHTLFPNGQRLEEQVSLELAHRVGRWHGDCSSESCLLSIPIQEGAYFNQVGDYAIVVEQFSRNNPLEGINSIGFALEETDQRR